MCVVDVVHRGRSGAEGEGAHVPVARERELMLLRRMRPKLAERLQGGLGDRVRTGGGVASVGSCSLL